MVRLEVVTFTVASLIGRIEGARKLHRSSKSSTSVAGEQDVYTTVDGCRCISDCWADLGEGYKCDTCRTADGCGKWSLFYRWDYCDYRPATVPTFTSRSSEGKLSYYWDKVIADRTRYPSYPLLSNLLSSVRTTFDNYRPEMPVGREKMIHTVGSVCQFELRISDSSPYTGLLGPGLQKGLIRLGGAVDPSTFGPGLTPGLGFKLPRTGVHDGDFVMLHSLAFGDQWNFFLKNQSNHLAPVSSLSVDLLVSKFQEASQCAFQVGLSDLARYSQDGTEHSPPKFPFKVFMTPNTALKTGTREHTIDAVQAEIDEIPAGSRLWSVYACAEAAGDEMNPSESLDSCGSPLFLGDVKTTSQCTTSRYGDASLHFRHQRIEEDWQLEPSYMNQGQYAANAVCGQSVSIDGTPPLCGSQGMLSTDQ